MAYIPPVGDAVNFTLGPISIPPGDAVNFNITTGGPISIICGESVIDITSLFYFTTGYLIQIDPSVIDILAFTDMFQRMTDIESGPSIIDITANTDLVRILPDCISNPSTIDFTVGTHEVVAGRVQDLPNQISSGGVAVLYGESVYSDEHTTVKWEQATWVDELIVDTTNKLDLIDWATDDSWKKYPIADNLVTEKFDAFPSLSDRHMSDYWKTLFPADTLSAATYGYKTEITDSLSVKYKQPGPQDREHRMKYDVLDQQTKTYHVVWGAPGPNDEFFTLHWGPISYFKFCNTQYYPPTNGMVKFVVKEKIPNDLVGACFQVVFDVEGNVTDPRCPYQHIRSGRRDPYISGIDISLPSISKSKEVYYMLNTVFVKTVITQTPIQILAASTTIDKDSWLWQFTFVIGDSASLELVKPVINVDGSVTFIDIELYINGWKFTCTVESWSENRSFGKDTWNISGRSPSLVLGAPQGATSSYTYIDSGAGLAGAAIMQAILLGQGFDNSDTGWEMDWTFYNDTVGTFTGFDPSNGMHWSIPDGKYSWTDKTPIDAIRQLTDSIGAYVQTNFDCADPDDKKLIVKPKFHIPPWHWSPTSVPGITETLINHKINAAICREIGRNFVSLPSYNAVFVTGQLSVPAFPGNSGEGALLAEVYRDGYGPSVGPYAPAITDPWITSPESAGELGRMTICDTGEWVHHTLSLFALRQKGTTDAYMVDVIQPGEIVQVTEKGKTWYGMVASTNLSVSMVAGAACAVVQTIEVREYIGKKD